MKRSMALPAAQPAGEGGDHLLPRILLASGTIEAVKWLSVLLMTLDHVNKYLLGDSLEWAFDAGRIVAPLFAFTLAYNLAQPGSLSKGRYLRSITRLGVFGVIATPVFIALGGLLDGWWPLNILFALMTSATVMFLIDRGGVGSYTAATAVFVVGGSLVEFWWPIIGFSLACWAYCKRPSWMALVVAVTCCSALMFINGNCWALAAFPVIFVASKTRITVPRTKWFVYYTYYPAHLTAIWAVHHYFGTAL